MAQAPSLIRALAALWLAAGGQQVLAAAPVKTTPLTVGVVSVADDARYAPRRADKRWPGQSTGRLLGAVTVDDLVDHMLPEDWRQTDEEEVQDGS